MSLALSLSLSSLFTWFGFNRPSPFTALANRSTSGSTNASVLPLPVAASAATSECAVSSGMTAAWTGVAAVKPCAASSASDGADRGREEKGTAGATEVDMTHGGGGVAPY